MARYKSEELCTAGRDDRLWLLQIRLRWFPNDDDDDDGGDDDGDGDGDGDGNWCENDDLGQNSEWSC